MHVHNHHFTGSHFTRARVARLHRQNMAISARCFWPLFGRAAAFACMLRPAPCCQAMSSLARFCMRPFFAALARHVANALVCSAGEHVHFRIVCSLQHDANCNGGHFAPHFVRCVHAGAGWYALILLPPARPPLSTIRICYFLRLRADPCEAKIWGFGGGPQTCR